jgi:hypothetical protein
MEVKIIKDWAHSKAPNQIFKKGVTAELSVGDIHAGIEGGFIQDPNKPEVKAVKPVDKAEKAMSKKVNEKR